eukprot:1798868-Prorocentrum_lima.AAC.1
MTSSLVGSEMCIRDSCTAAIIIFGVRSFVMSARAAQQVCRTWVKSLAVSYTHLTLPTICSV